MPWAEPPFQLRVGGWPPESDPGRQGSAPAWGPRAGLGPGLGGPLLSSAPSPAAGVTWGKVVSLYSVAAGLAVDGVRQAQPAVVPALIDCLGEFVHKTLASWLRRRGGWVSGGSGCRPQPCVAVVAADRGLPGWAAAAVTPCLCPSVVGGRASCGHRPRGARPSAEVGAQGHGHTRGWPWVGRHYPQVTPVSGAPPSQRPQGLDAFLLPFHGARLGWMGQGRDPPARGQAAGEERR